MTRKKWLPTPLGDVDRHRVGNRAHSHHGLGQPIQYSACKLSLDRRSDPPRLARFAVRGSEWPRGRTA